MTAHLTTPDVLHVTPDTGGPSLVDSARYEQPHTRALRRALEKYGPTPIWDALVVRFGDPRQAATQ